MMHLFFWAILPIAILTAVQFIPRAIRRNRFRYYFTEQHRVEQIILNAARDWTEDRFLPFSEWNGNYPVTVINIRAGSLALSFRLDFGKAHPVFLRSNIPFPAIPLATEAWFSEKQLSRILEVIGEYLEKNERKAESFTDETAS